MFEVSFITSGVKRARPVSFLKDAAQSFFVLLKGMMNSGFRSFLIRESRIVDPPQKLQKAAASVSSLTISPPHCGQVKIVTS